MNYGLILAGGTGLRMQTSGLPKQFLTINDKPIIIYTIEKFISCPDIDNIIIVCHTHYISYMQELLEKYYMNGIEIVRGGKSRLESIFNGVEHIKKNGGNADDIIVIHDGVRPLVKTSIISENVAKAYKYGSAMTVMPVCESVVVAKSDIVSFEDFNKRDDTMKVTSPQSFTLSSLTKAFNDSQENAPIPLIDAALACAYTGSKIALVKEDNYNIKVTTPEDYYILKALIDLQEH